MKIIWFNGKRMPVLLASLLFLPIVSAYIDPGTGGYRMVRYSK